VPFVRPDLGRAACALPSRICDSTRPPASLAIHPWSCVFAIFPAKSRAAGSWVRAWNDCRLPWFNTF